MVEFAAMQAVDIDSVQRHSRKLQEMAAALGGDYLGWRTQPVRLQRKNPYGPYSRG